MDSLQQFKHESIKDEMVEESVDPSQDHEDDIHLLLQAHNSTLGSPSELQQEAPSSHDMTDSQVEEMMPPHPGAEDHVSHGMCHPDDQGESPGNPSIADMEAISAIHGVDIVTLQPSQIQPMFQIMGSIREGTSYVLSDGQLVPATCSGDGQPMQSVTLPSGMAALIADNKDNVGMEGQAIQLEDGTTAIVQNLQKENSLASKILEGQVIQLEDGTTGLIQAGLPGNDSVQSVQLEDGSTAYISLFGAGAGALGIDGSSHVQAISQAMEIASGPQRQVIVPEPTAITMKLDASQDPANKTPTSNNSAQPHISEKAMALGDKAYKCLYEGCGRLYTTHHHLKVHERSHTGDKPFRCEFPSCGKAFPTGYGLKSHTRVHTGEKPYRCSAPDCIKAFKTSGDLQKHVRTHTGERPFPCPFEGCDRSFTTSNIRKVHIRTHTGERPYICGEDGCGKSFASATNYKNHIRIHTGEKPYVCTVEGCGKRFTEYSSLYKHHVVHTQSKPYVCNHCNKTYRQTSTLAMHKRTIHNDHDMSLDPEEALLGTVGGVQIMHPVEADNQSDRDQEMTEGDGTLVINTSDASLIASGNNQPGGPSMLTTLQTVPRGSSALLQHLQPSGLGVQTGVPVQQVYLITDPNQLETIKNLASQQQQQSSSESELLKNSEGVNSANGTAAGTTTTIAMANAEQLLDGTMTVVSPSGESSILKPMYT